MYKSFLIEINFSYQTNYTETLTQYQQPAISYWKILPLQIQIDVFPNIFTISSFKQSAHSQQALMDV